MNIRIIAKACDVSPSTVSRILNNKPDVNPETRKKVIETMDEMGFRPSLVSGNHESIGIITPQVIFTEFMGELLIAIMETAYSINKNLTLIPIGGEGLREGENITHFCRQRGLSGIIMIAPPIESKLPQQLSETDIPHVIVAGTYKEKNISWVDVDNTGGVDEAITYLMESGHRRVALINSKLYTQCLKDRVDGYYKAHKRYEIEPDPNIIFETVDAGMNLSDVVGYLVKSPNPPTAIFCTTYRDSISVLNQLQKEGVKVPEEISVAGFGDYQVSPYTNPPMTTVHQPIYEMGRSAINLFNEIRNGDRRENKYEMLSTKLMIRDSTRALNKSEITGEDV
ncbi:LacI family DNA-binding transcriptional regulator [Radiobacillus sp. PE A8.2]|uniref:LacI family DNA-binding transcriptional regulator n=1 Tax=Radiobacillus sp. PE A8.2 TaxID=3380349 RepID=UPI00388F7947